MVHMSRRTMKIFFNMFLRAGNMKLKFNISAILNETYFYCIEILSNRQTSSGGKIFIFTNNVSKNFLKAMNGTKKSRQFHQLVRTTLFTIGNVASRSSVG